MVFWLHAAVAPVLVLVMHPFSTAPVLGVSVTPWANPNGSLPAIYRYLCQHQLQSCCLDLRAEQRSTLAALYRRLLIAPPRHALKVTTRPRPLQLNCRAEKYRKVFTGETRASPAYLVDMFPIGFELDLLEVRLYETDGVVDATVVAESSYTHRGERKPLYFAAEQHRFAHFQARVKHVLLDCPQVVDLVHSRATRPQDKAVWDIQDAQRRCASDHLNNLTLPPGVRDEDVLVLFTDLDEVPSGEDLFHAKHCVWIDPARPTVLGFLATGLGNLRNALQRNCAPAFDFVRRPLVNLKHHVRGRVLDIFKERQHDFQSGMHLTYYGSFAVIDYKKMTHAEGGRFPVTLNNADVCQVTDQDLRAKQMLVSENPDGYVYFFRTGQTPARQQPLPHIDLAVPETKARLQACGVPWLVLENPARFPQFYGELTYEDLQDL
jgi:hypothetical protein